VKKKQTKWIVLEMFLAGPGTRKEVWKRNPEAIQWETFKRVSAALRSNGLLETFGPQPIPSQSGQTPVRLTLKGRRAVEGWRIVRERG
jgi:hypothetical protein